MGIGSALLCLLLAALLLGHVFYRYRFLFRRVVPNCGEAGSGKDQRKEAREPRMRPSTRLGTLSWSRISGSTAP